MTRGIYSYILVLLAIDTGGRKGKRHKDQHVDETQRTEAMTDCRASVSDRRESKLNVQPEGAAAPFFILEIKNDQLCSFYQ